MRQSIIVLGGACVAVLIAGVGTYASSGTESTTPLDSVSTVTVDGHKALDPKVVAGRMQSMYHPLPWVGSAISATTCPRGLRAEAGASVSCTAKDSGGEQVTIKATTVSASDTSITWKFDR
jgi:Domain of unknown function (DUF4333)